MASIKEAVMGKKDEFKIDDAYKAFEEFFNETAKEDLAKILFTYMYNRELRRLDDIGKLPEGKANNGRRSGDFKRSRGSRHAGRKPAGGRGGNGKKNFSKERGGQKRSRKPSAQCLAIINRNSFLQKESSFFFSQRTDSVRSSGFYNLLLFFGRKLDLIVGAIDLILHNMVKHIEKTLFFLLFSPDPAFRALILKYKPTQL